MLSSVMSSKKSIRKKFILEGIFAILIAITPIMFYWYKYIPVGNTSYSFLGIEFGNNGFNDVADSFYYYFGKIVPLLLLIIWFITSKEWWYYTILIPIAMYSFQLFSVLTFESGIVDENEILYVIAVTMVVVPIVYFIRLKLVDKHVHGIDLDAMDTELRILKEKEELRKEREKLEQQRKTALKKM